MRDLASSLSRGRRCTAPGGPGKRRHGDRHAWPPRVRGDTRVQPRPPRAVGWRCRRRPEHRSSRDRSRGRSRHRPAVPIVSSPRWLVGSPSRSIHSSVRIGGVVALVTVVSYRGRCRCRCSSIAVGGCIGISFRSDRHAERHRRIFRSPSRLMAPSAASSRTASTGSTRTLDRPRGSHRGSATYIRRAIDADGRPPPVSRVLTGVNRMGRLVSTRMGVQAVPVSRSFADRQSRL